MDRAKLIDILRQRDLEWYVKTYFLQEVKEHLRLPLPEAAFEKFKNAGKEYGAFVIDQDWIKELHAELDDGVFYKFLDMHKKLLQFQKTDTIVGWSDVTMALLPGTGLEIISPPSHVESLAG